MDLQQEGPMQSHGDSRPIKLSCLHGVIVLAYKIQHVSSCPNAKYSKVYGGLS